MNLINFSEAKTILFNNITTRQTIFKNTFWLSISSAISKFLGLILLIYAARILGAEEYGKFTFALAFVSLFVIFYSFGLPAIIVREFARDKEKKEDFYSIISLQILLILGTFILILLSSLFISSDPSIRRIILFLSFFSFINGFIAILYSFFESRQKMEYEAWFYIIQFLLMFSFGFFILFNFPSAINLSYAYLFSAIVALIIILFFFHFKVLSLKVRYNFFIWKKFLIISWPLALTGLFGAIYNYTDSIMMGYWKMMAETGWYNAAYKIVIATLIPAGLISSSFYPVLSEFSKGAKEKFQRIWNYQLEIMILFALPLVVGGTVLASRIIYSFYSLDFTPSILSFQILILTVGIMFLYRPFYDVMIILNQQKKMFWITLIGAIVNIILNLLLIPKYTLYGAAVATLITNFLILLVITVFIKKFTFLHIPVMRSLLIFLVSIISTIFMYFIVIKLLSINIFILVILGMMVYFISFGIIRKYILLKYFKQIYNV